LFGMQDLNTRKRSKLIFDLVVQIDFVFSHYYKIQFHINRFLTTVEFHQTACSDHKNPLLFEPTWTRSSPWHDRLHRDQGRVCEGGRGWPG
jgi:hypothetical protein